MAYSGISEGGTEADDSNSYRPYQEVARCDMAAFLHRMAGNLPPATAGAQFIDVSTDTPHTEHFAWLSGEGVSTKFPDGAFRPYETVV
jgi:hypothetical protein